MRPPAKAVISTADKHPLAHLSGKIWGINIVRSMADLDGAPEPIVRAFKMFTSTPTPNKCACCGKMHPDELAGGVAVLRTTSPGEQAIAMGVCLDCMSEPDSNKLTPRIVKLLTGEDKRSVNWKDSMQ